MPVPIMNGTATPAQATRVAVPPTLINSEAFTSRPTRKSRNMAPKSESALKNYERSASTRILKRIEQPEDLVGTALYLLSDLSTFVTGQTILVNGGAVLVG